MKSFEDMYKNICRLCLGYENHKKMVSLFDDSCKDGVNSYAKAVSSLTNIFIERKDKLPSFMCLKCLNLLKQAIYFKLQCEYNDRCLKNIARDFPPNEDFRQAVVELFMLNIYFDRKYSFMRKEKDNKEKTIVTKNKNTDIEDNVNMVLEFGTNIDSSKDNFSELESDAEHTLSPDDEIKRMEAMFGSNKHPAVNTKQGSLRRKFKRTRKCIRNKLYMHDQIEPNKNGNLLCNICNKTLANQHTYEHHMQRHNGCRFMCEHCGKGFPVLTELQVHQVCRHGTGPSLQCSQCPYKAARKFDLVEHERIHSGERPYTCDKCGLTFRRRGIWKKHLIYHTEKKVQCPQCHRKFFQRSEMLAHANNVHDRVYVYVCSKCGATYAKIATVRRHMTDRHGIPRDSQGKVMRVHKSSSCVGQ